MTEREARTHTHVSNRAIQTSREKKTIFRSALDTPFRVPWPKIPANIQDELQKHLISALEGVTNYRATLEQLNRKRKREACAQSSSETQEVTEDADDNDDDDVNTVIDTGTKALVDHLTIGLNAVTARLECQIRERRNFKIVISESNAIPLEAKPDLCLILVCRADVDPPLLVDHLPHLVAACNALNNNSVRLASLPQGAEATLAQTLGMRRVTVVGLDVEFPGLERFKPYFESMPIPFASWLSTISLSQKLIPTHVKQVKTSAPKNMKEAKEERKKGRAQAKERKRIKIRSFDV